MLGDMLAYGFMQRALIAGIVIGIVCATLSFFVVLRRLSFIGVGISHSAFGGVAIGVLLGIEPLVAAAVFAVGVAWTIGFVSQRGRLAEDTVIGVMFSTAMALGVALLSLSRGYQVDLFSYLFGSILAVSHADLWMIGIAGAAVLASVLLLFKELLFVTFDEEVARASGVPASAVYYLLLTALAVTIIASIRVVGIILVEALLVLPAATAAQITRGYRSMLAVALLLGLVSTVGGLILSYAFNVASGATIVLVASSFFFAALVIGKLRRPRSQRLSAAVSPGPPARAPET